MREALDAKAPRKLVRLLGEKDEEARSMVAWTLGSYAERELIGPDAANELVIIWTTIMTEFVLTRRWLFPCMLGGGLVNPGHKSS